MFSRIQNYLKSPDDTDPLFIKLVQNLLVFSLVANVAAILVTTGIFNNNFNLTALVALSITAFLEAVSLYSVVYRKNVQMGKYIVPLALTIAITFVAGNGNTIHDIAITAFPVIIILAFLMQGGKAMVLTVPLVSLAFVILGALDMLGLSQSVIADRTGFDDIAIGIILSVASGASLQLLTTRLNSSLMQAKENEAAQLKTNQELRELQASLEQRVEARTAELAASTAQLEKRARQLEAISDISRSIALVQDVEELLPQITQLISTKFNFYHVGIFLLDEKQEYAVLRAANSEGGRRMLNRQHKLKVELSSLVGFASMQRQARIALDVGDDVVFFNNPDLPDTRSEIALPMLIGDRVIGVLDVQSTEPSAFSPDDIQILTTLTNEVAIAIENARLFRESRASAEAAEKVYRQFVVQGWQRAIGTTPNVGYRLSENGVDALTEPLSASEIRKAAEQGDMVVVEEKKRSALAVPIKVRDQVIGVLNVRSQVQGYRWDEEELTLVRALADRVALALENARLLADAQRRAAKEQTIGEISAKLGTSINIDNVLRTALLELGKILPGSEIFVEFERDTNK